MKRFSDQSEFVAEQFKGTDYSGRQLNNKAFYDCRFSDSSFRETSFTGCNFRDCTFVNCDLSLMTVGESSFAGVTFEKSKVIGVNWTAAHWSKFLTAAPIDFHNCIIDYSTFIGLSLQGIKITHCRARDVDFSEADLSGADFSDTVLTASRFSQTNLTRANFAGASEYKIDVNANQIRNARFSLPEAVSLLYSLDIDLVE